LRTRTVRPGDAMLVPAGLPHTVERGVFVLELQEPTDLSILLEWQDFAVDGTRDGHLDLGFDTALQAVDYTGVSDADLDRLVLAREEIEGAGLRSIMPREADGYFRAQRFDAAAGPVTVDAGFAIVLILDGKGSLATATDTVPVTRGDAVLVPFAAGDYTLTAADGALVGVASRPPAHDAPTNVR
jgi:mannose-6-phosphate isomerase